MPRLPRITGGDLLRALHRDGWQVKRQRGSHHILDHPTKPGLVIVAVHAGEIVKPGTLSGILDDAGLSLEQLRNLL